MGDCMELIDIFFNSSLKEIGAIIVFVIIIVICTYLNKKKDTFGDFFAKITLIGLDKSIYTVLNDIVLNIDGMSCKIDHIVVSKYGVFVIKTKYYKGYVIGSKKDVQWLTRFNMRKSYVPNPIMENAVYVKRVCDLLGLDETKVFNIVCVPDVCRIEVRGVKELVKYGGLTSKIMMHNEVVINDVNSVVDKIRKIK